MINPACLSLSLCFQLCLLYRYRCYYSIIAPSCILCRLLLHGRSADKSWALPSRVLRKSYSVTSGLRASGEELDQVRILIVDFHMLSLARNSIKKGSGGDDSITALSGGVSAPEKPCFPYVSCLLYVFFDFAKSPPDPRAANFAVFCV